jgi:3-methyladenine DNA glycosylase AlkD
MTDEMIALAEQLEAEWSATGSSERAVKEKAYLKSDLEFLGTGFFEVGRRVRELVKASSLDRERAVALALALWRRPVFECRAAAVEVLARCETLLGPADLATIEGMIRQSRTWALVDGLAGDVASAIVARHPEASGAVLDRWAIDPDFWLRRSALLAELKPLKAGAAFDRFGRHADAMLDEKEFFIRKAIGWMLRETAKRRPDEVTAWLAPRTARASGVTMREALRYLPTEAAEALMAGFKARQPTVWPAQSVQRADAARAPDEPRACPGRSSGAG